MPTVDLPPAVLLTFAGLLGLSFGSFLNVIIRRLPMILEQRWLNESRAILDAAEEKSAVIETTSPLSISLPASYCPACKKKLKAIHKVPILSYLFLHGRCGFCKAPISHQYPLVEFLALLAALAIASQTQASLQTLAALIFSWALIALSFIDVNRRLLPDELTIGLLWGGLLANAYGLFVPPVDSILGALVGYVALWLIYHVMRLATGRHGMGHGDMKLLAAIGAWCGWQSLPVILLMASVSALAISMILLATRKMKRNDPVPFGPYLAIAAWLFFTHVFIYKWPLPMKPWPI